MSNAQFEAMVLEKTYAFKPSVDDLEQIMDCLVQRTGRTKFAECALYAHSQQANFHIKPVDTFYTLLLNTLIKERSENAE